MLQNHTDRYDSSVVPPRFTNTGVDIAFTAMLVVLSASFAATAVGDPELLALVACSGIAVMLACYVVLALDGRIDSYPQN